MFLRNSNIVLKGWLLCTLLCFFYINVSAQREEQEANLKAAFIYNFTKYIEWDTSAARNNFIIGIIGSSPITESLIEIGRTYTVNNKKIVVRQFSKPEDVNYCNILFIPNHLPFSLESILSKVGKATLTISEEDGYAKMGTALNFVIINDKLKFEANLKTIYSEGLKAGSQLLKLAIIVD